MDTIIQKKNMRTGLIASDWKQAVRLAGAVLEENKSITNEYTESMISAVEEMGPYMVIMPGFAIAHAAPSPAVLREDMGLITLQTPVSFGSPNDPVSVILCIACVDRDSHVMALQRVAIALEEDTMVERLSKAANVDALFDVLHGKN